MTPNDNVALGEWWTKQRLAAAALVADGWISDRKIAEQLGIHVATLERWKQRPDFRQHVAGLMAVFREQLLAAHAAEELKRRQVGRR